ncbi:MAG: SET domain-containing protein-lysine N-methyltransferase [Sphingobacteriia bacterium]|nr:SET domain-containing protein-lysine N-methyltransferase [Sphingobacteriia bacterium]
MKVNTAARTSFRLISTHSFAEIMENEINGEKSLHSIASFQPDDVICSFAGGVVSNTPTYLTVQTSNNEHITLVPEFLQYINHSCTPNVFFNTTTFQLTALKKIEPGDEFTFFYPSTEWDMAQPFACTCGTATCLQHISGAKYIDKTLLAKHKLTDFIQSMLNK